METIKPSKWLAGLDAWTLYDGLAIAERFKAETGLDPCWHTVTVADVNATHGQIKGVTSPVSGRDTERLATGYDIAEAIADKYAPGIERPYQFGRGSRFAVAVDALKRAGL